MMRTIFLLPKLFLVFLLSCSDSDCEDDVAVADINKLHGEWILQKSELNGEEVDSHDRTEFTIDTSAKFTHTDAGQNNVDIIDSGSFYVVGNTVVINWNNNINGHSVTKYQILELTETKLKWKIVVPHVGTHIETFFR